MFKNVVWRIFKVVWQETIFRPTKTLEDIEEMQILFQSNLYNQEFQQKFT